MARKRKRRRPEDPFYGCEPIPFVTWVARMLMADVLQSDDPERMEAAVGFLKIEAAASLLIRECPAAWDAAVVVNDRMRQARTRQCEAASAGRWLEAAIELQELFLAVRDALPREFSSGSAPRV